MPYEVRDQVKGMPPVEEDPGYIDPALTEPLPELTSLKSVHRLRAWLERCPARRMVDEYAQLETVRAWAEENRSHLTAVEAKRLTDRVAYLTASAHHAHLHRVKWRPWGPCRQIRMQVPVAWVDLVKDLGRRFRSSKSALWRIIFALGLARLSEALEALVEEGKISVGELNRTEAEHGPGLPVGTGAGGGDNALPDSVREAIGGGTESEFGGLEPD